MYFQLSPSSWVVEALDVIKDISSGFGVRVVSTTIDPFAFQHSEEALACCIVSTTANAAHRTREVVAFQEALIVTAGELTATITVQDHWLP